MKNRIYYFFIKDEKIKTVHFTQSECLERYIEQQTLDFDTDAHSYLVKSAEPAGIIAGIVLYILASCSHVRYIFRNIKIF